IPGFQTHLAPEEFKRQVQEIGLAIIGQTDTIVPADKKIYALRNSTATVNSIPLITASIMSKKLAEGIDALVLDVKVGQGSFFREKVEALKLARSLIAAGEKFGLKTVALLTAMNQPLGKAVGNWLETREAIQTLKGKGPSDLLEVVLALGAEMLVLAGKAITVEDGIQKLQVLLKAGTAYKKFLQLVERQHGSKHLIEHPETYPEPQYSASIKSPRKGFLCRINARTIGLASMALGAGRVKMTDDIDYGAGMVLEKKVGDEVDANEMIAQVFSNRKMAIENSLALIETAFEISEEKPEPEALILGRMDATDLI
ncbi:MAG: thymidine phosphorylase, partial [candidate division KSB1 bacterium]|nr:thymidine phosphorylase [candidate division KSB1 bacterium]